MLGTDFTPCSVVIVYPLCPCIIDVYHLRTPVTSLHSLAEDRTYVRLDPVSAPVYTVYIE